MAASKLTLYFLGTQYHILGAPRCAYDNEYKWCSSTFCLTGLKKSKHDRQTYNKTRHPQTLSIEKQRYLIMHLKRIQV